MSSLADINVHVREVRNIVNNQLPTRPTSDSVAQSWARCLNEFRLDPARFVMPPVLTQQELTARREAASDLIACSKLEMTTLYQQLADPELAVVLVDASDGETLIATPAAGEGEEYTECLVFHGDQGACQRHRIRGVEDVSYQGTTLHAHVDSEGLGHLIRVLGDTGVRSLISQPPTLEELFMRHYGADGQRELSDQGARS